jgi:hypothetical protein
MNDRERNHQLTMADAKRNNRLAEAFEPLDRFEIPHVSIEDTDDELLKAAVRLINHFGGFYNVQLAPNRDLWDAIRLVRGEQPSPFSGQDSL